MSYAIVRPDGAVRATTSIPVEIPDHRCLPIVRCRPGVLMADFGEIPADAQEIPAPYDLAVLQAALVADDKAEAGHRLAPTDWYVIRRADTGQDIPAEIQTARQAIRDASNAREAWITAPARTVAELIILAGIPAWPND